MTVSRPSAASGAPWSFGRFEAGSVIGTAAITFDGDMLQKWEALFGPVASGAALPMGAVPLLIMRAFADVVTPRPAGNLHVAQTCELRLLPAVGQTTVARVSCHSKEMRGERRVVRFDIQVSEADTGTPLFSGLTTIFWAT